MPKSVELSGTALRAFLRELVRTEPGVSDELAERVTKRGAAAITRMLVVRDIHLGWRRHRHSAMSLSRRIYEARPADPASPGHTIPSVDQAPTEAMQPALALPPPLDPYIFAIEALLIKQGEAALAERLELITNVDHLRAIARAQRISLDPELAADPGTTASMLRQAIVRGAGKRLADRRAAAG